MTLATVLVLFIIAVELYRPIIVGNAIDQYINGYYHPYVEADVSAPDAINWNGLEPMIRTLIFQKPGNDRQTPINSRRTGIMNSLKKQSL